MLKHYVGDKWWFVRTENEVIVGNDDSDKVLKMTLDEWISVVLAVAGKEDAATQEEIKELYKSNGTSTKS